MKIIDTTDKKHVGEDLNYDGSKVIFNDGTFMQITNEIKMNEIMILANSNYIIYSRK